jgi:hypothetical protein
VMILLLWTVGLVAGSVHPLGFMAALSELAVFTWFAVALGTFISLRAKTTLRAQAATMAILLFLNLGYMMCCIPLRPNTPMIALGCTPFLQAVALLSFKDVSGLFDATSPWFHSGAYREAGELFMASTLGLLGYGIAALVLMHAAFGTFDRVVDRPHYPTEFPFESSFNKPDRGKPGEMLGDDTLAG